MTTPDWVAIATLQAAISQARELVDELRGSCTAWPDEQDRITLQELVRMLDLPEELLKQ